MNCFHTNTFSFEYGEKPLSCTIDFAIDEIDSFFDDKEKTYDVYRGDILLKRAIERNLEIIGEALSRILKEDPEFKIENARRIIGLRNQLIHGYDSVSDENIWGIIVIHQPGLKANVGNLISGL